MAGLLIDPFLSVVDTGYIARLGTSSLAACGPCTSVFQFAWAVPRALSLSTVTLVASGLAAQTDKYGLTASKTSIGDHRDVAQVSLSLAIFYGFLTMGILTAFGPQVLAIMGAPIGSKIGHFALPYLLVRGLGYLAVTMLASAEGICRGHGDTITPF